MTTRDRVVLSVSRPVTYLGFTLASKVDACRVDYCRFTAFQILLRCHTDGTSSGTCVADRPQVTHGTARVVGARVITRFGGWRDSNWAAYDSGTRAAVYEYALVRERSMTRMPPGARAPAAKQP